MVVESSPLNTLVKLMTPRQVLHHTSNVHFLINRNKFIVVFIYEIMYSCVICAFVRVLLSFPFKCTMQLGDDDQT